MTKKEDEEGQKQLWSKKDDSGRGIYKDAHESGVESNQPPVVVAWCVPILIHLYVYKIYRASISRSVCAQPLPSSRVLLCCCCCCCCCCTSCVSYLPLTRSYTGFRPFRVSSLESRSLFSRSPTPVSDAPSPIFCERKNKNTLCARSVLNPASFDFVQFGRIWKAIISEATVRNRYKFFFFFVVVVNKCLKHRFQRKCESEGVRRAVIGVSSEARVARKVLVGS